MYSPGSSVYYVFQNTAARSIIIALCASLRKYFSMETRTEYEVEIDRERAVQRGTEHGNR